MTTASLYERLGGGDAVVAAVGVLHEKLLADRELAPFFRDVDMAKLVQKQIAFVTLAFGGPGDGAVARLRPSHAPLVARGLEGRHFDAVKRHFFDALIELGVTNELATEAAGIVETTRADVLGG